MIAPAPVMPTPHITHPSPRLLSPDDSGPAAADPPPGGCHQVSLLGLDPGHTSVTVRLSEPWPAAEARVLVGAYRPLAVAPPADGEGLLMAPLASWRLQAEGGPLPWPTRPDRHQATGTAGKELGLKGWYCDNLLLKRVVA